MAERLVAYNEKGWKKVEDNGITKYRDPQGRYAKEQQWAGSFADGTEKKTPEFDDPPVPPSRWDVLVRDDLDSYDTAIDHELELFLPIGSVDLDNCMSQMANRARMMENMDKIGYSVEYEIILEDGESQGVSFRHTRLKTYNEMSQIEAEFLKIWDELRKLLDSYKDVVIRYLRVKGRDYKQEYK